MALLSRHSCPVLMLIVICLALIESNCAWPRQRRSYIDSSINVVNGTCNVIHFALKDSKNRWESIYNYIDDESVMNLELGLCEQQLIYCTECLQAVSLNIVPSDESIDPSGIEVNFFSFLISAQLMKKHFLIFGGRDAEINHKVAVEGHGDPLLLELSYVFLNDEDTDTYHDDISVLTWFMEEEKNPKIGDTISQSSKVLISSIFEFRDSTGDGFTPELLAMPICKDADSFDNCIYQRFLLHEIILNYTAIPSSSENIKGTPGLLHLFSFEARLLITHRSTKDKKAYVEPSDVGRVRADCYTSSHEVLLSSVLLDAGSVKCDLVFVDLPFLSNSSHLAVRLDFSVSELDLNENEGSDPEKLRQSYSEHQNLNYQKTKYGESDSYTVHVDATFAVRMNKQVIVDGIIEPVRFLSINSSSAYPSSTEKTVATYFSWPAHGARHILWDPQFDRDKKKSIAITNNPLISPIPFAEGHEGNSIDINVNSPIEQENFYSTGIWVGLCGGIATTTVIIGIVVKRMRVSEERDNFAKRQRTTSTMKQAITHPEITEETNYITISDINPHPHMSSPFDIISPGESSTMKGDVISPGAFSITDVNIDSLNNPLRSPSADSALQPSPLPDQYSPSDSDKNESLNIEDRFLAAALIGDAKELSSLLDTDHNNVAQLMKAHAGGEDDDTAAMLCARGGHVEALETLIADGRLKLAGSDGKGPLQLLAACEGGHMPMVRYLLAQNVSANPVGERAVQPLVAAARTGCLELISALLASGAKTDLPRALRRKAHEDPPSFQGMDLSALSVAVQLGHTEVVRALLQHNADTRCAELGRCWTPLHFAAATGEVEAVRLLLDANAPLNDPSVMGHTPLWLAAREGHVEVIEMLLNRDPTLVTTHDKQGVSALDIAAKGSSQEAFKLLIVADTQTSPNVIPSPPSLNNTMVH